MAKRAGADEKPFRPLETSLIRSVMVGNTAQVVAPVETAPVVQLPVQEPKPVAPAPVAPPPEPVVLKEERPAVEARPKVAVRSPVERRPKPAALVDVVAERMDREKRVLLTASEERAIERVVANLGAELGTTLKLSHVLRSCMLLLVNAEQELLDRARSSAPLVRPPNGDMPALAEFDKAVAAVVAAGLRNARAIR